MIKTITLLALVATVYSNDLKLGPTDGRNIYNETLEYSPAIWRQKQNVTISTTDAEVISAIVVTDLRPEKDGEAKIVEGGEGQKQVTIELQSPTALRGFKFHVEVYVAEDKNSQNPPTNENPQHPTQTRVERQSTNIPVIENTKSDGTTSGPSKQTTLPPQVTEAKISTPILPIPISSDNTDLANNQERNRGTPEIRSDVPQFGINIPNSPKNTADVATTESIVSHPLRNTRDAQKQTPKPKDQPELEDQEDKTSGIFPAVPFTLPSLPTNNKKDESTVKPVDQASLPKSDGESVKVPSILINDKITPKAEVTEKTVKVTEHPRGVRDTDATKDIPELVEPKDEATSTTKPEITPKVPNFHVWDSKVYNPSQPRQNREFIPELSTTPTTTVAYKNK